MVVNQAFICVSKSIQELNLQLVKVASYFRSNRIYFAKISSLVSFIQLGNASMNLVIVRSLSKFPLRFSHFVLLIPPRISQTL